MRLPGDISSTYLECLVTESVLHFEILYPASLLFFCGNYHKALCELKRERLAQC